eukprot:TRINITY_DN429_c0_g1_i4.p1 TRINITY_DN429_c0_g1~~TRINITY_DN429_c0_g1_i4.p1  ORF type:complete len:173 (-),score=10.29 TRINITY_DN429_c0_g1_i4:1-519(-)
MYLNTKTKKKNIKVRRRRLKRTRRLDPFLFILWLFYLLFFFFLNDDHIKSRNYHDTRYHVAKKITLLITWTSAGCLTKSAGLTLGLHEGKDIVFLDRSLNVSDDASLAGISEDLHTDLGHSSTGSGTADNLVDLSEDSLVSSVWSFLLSVLYVLGGGGHLTIEGDINKVQKL